METKKTKEAPRVDNVQKAANVEGSILLKKVIRYAVALVLFLVATNPSILFFLPEGAKNSLKSIWSGVFGNVD